MLLSGLVFVMQKKSPVARDRWKGIAIRPCFLWPLPNYLELTTEDALGAVAVVGSGCDAETA